MSKFKPNNSILIILVLSLAFFIISESIVASARAGGGHSSSSHSSSSYHSSLNRYSSNQNNQFIKEVVLCISIFASLAGTVISKYRINMKLNRKKSNCIRTIKILSKSDNSWDYNNIKNDIEKAFYSIQNAWMERDHAWAIEHMSKKLYDDHREETEVMRMMNEKNIIKDLKLINIVPIGINVNKTIDYKCLWVYIKAEAIDYIIHEETNIILEGSKDESYKFKEYWKFVRENDRWVADKILQIDDISDLNFFKIEIHENVE